MGHSWKKQTLIDACRTSTSIRQVITKLGLIPAGGNYQSVKKYIKLYDIDTSHFTGKGWSKGNKYGPKRTLEEILVYGEYLSDRLRKRLLAEGVKEHCCESCNNTDWLGLPIALELEHVDGDHKNNVLTNLKLLCPNCHAQTETYRGKNRGKANG